MTNELDAPTPAVTVWGGGQPVGSPVLTPTGFVPIESCIPGDEVISVTGQPVTVTATHRGGRRSAYRLVFSDDSTAESCTDHRWTTARPGTRSTTRPLAALVGAGLCDGRGAGKFAIPTAAAVQLHDAGHQPLHPYALGALLGDGGMSTHGVYFATADHDLLTELLALLPDGVQASKVKGDAYSYYLRGPHGQTRWKRNPVTEALEELGLMGHRSETKFVPDAYLYGSEATRLAVLQGLLDTDGTVERDKGGVEFTSASSQLTDAVVSLTRSLGGRARPGVKKTSHLDAHRTKVRLPVDYQPFRLARKAAIYEALRSARPVSDRRLVAAEPIGERDMVGIVVSADDGLYVTQDFIVTHDALDRS